MNFKQIASFDNYMLANMTLGMLQENEIICHLKDEYIVTTDPLLNPAVGGIKLLVEESQYEEAVAVMKDAEDAYLKDLACPNCSSHSLVVEEKIDKPESFWSKLKNQIAYGQVSTYSKQYRCTNCSRVFTELPASF
jgi:DNA-directed RNA polymerase subunit RPC12/RpoP